MANDFTSVSGELVAQVLNTHPNTSSLIKAAMVRQLQALQPEIVPFMELSGSFNTVANQAAYTYASTGMPKGLLQFQRLWYDMGNYARPIEPADVLTIRALQEHPSIAYPWRCAWWEEKLQFGPAPAAVYPVKWDIVLDATKDTATGNLITTASTSETNAWFLLPQVAAFKALVLGDYYSTSPDQRPEMAQAQQQAAQVALVRLREAGQKRQGLNSIAIVPSAYDLRSSSMAARSVRVSRLFPGAPV